MASQRSVVVSSAKCAASWAEERRPFTDPIEIPAVASGAARRDDREDAEGDYGGEAVVVPPHVLLARRRAAFSMCSGQGRTLKGRDLRRVRDSVLRMTGFIES
uniref:Senescence regulator n=1 Tax=Leersia perrieri TaxID=77586 RepID=A0A0D9V572_9ORYZ